MINSKISETTIEISSDGGRRDSGEAAAAAIISNSTSKLKIVAFLENQNPERAELCGLLLGLSACEAIVTRENLKSFQIVWTTDCKTILEGLSKLDTWEERNWLNSSGNPLANRDLWEVVLEHHKNIHSRHQSHNAQVKKCHQACDWIMSLGLQHCKTRFDSFLSTTNHQHKQDSWYLIDGRQTFDKPRKTDLDKTIYQAFEKLKCEPR